MRLDLRKLYSAEAAFVMGGLGFLAVAFAFDVTEHLARVAADPDHVHGGGNLLIRLNLPLMGMALVTFGLGMHVLDHHRDRLHVTAYVAGLLIAIDGIAHMFAVSDHITAPLQAGFFATVAVVQIGGGILLPFLPRRFDRWWIVLTVVLVALYVASRRVAVPGLWEIEEAEGLGLFSKVVEVFSLFPLWALVKGSRPAAAGRPEAKAAEP